MGRALLASRLLENKNLRPLVAGGNCRLRQVGAEPRLRIMRLLPSAHSDGMVMFSVCC